MKWPFLMSKQHFLPEKFGCFTEKLYLCTNYRLLHMKRRLFIISLLTALTYIMPMSVSAAPAYFAGVMEMAQDQDVNITYSEGTLFVTGCEGQTLEIVSLTGKKIMDVKIESPAQKIELNIPKGCYIVKVGKVVRKVSIR